MSLISIAQKETFHISFVQFANKDCKADLLTPESYYIKKIAEHVFSTRSAIIITYFLLLPPGK